MATIKRASLYIDSQKLGECSTSSIDINNNTDRLDGQEGVVGGTDGNQHFDFQFDMIIVQGFPGAESKVIDAVLSQKEVTLAYLFGGKLISCPAKFTRAQIRSESRTGTLSGNFSAQNTGPAQVA